MSEQDNGLNDKIRRAIESDDVEHLAYLVVLGKRGKTLPDTHVFLANSLVILNELKKYCNFDINVQLRSGKTVLDGVNSKIEWAKTNDKEGLQKLELMKGFIIRAGGKTGAQLRG